jgi:hypothetical protein
MQFKISEILVLSLPPKQNENRMKNRRKHSNLDDIEKGFDPKTNSLGSQTLQKITGSKEKYRREQNEQGNFVNNPDWASLATMHFFMPLCWYYAQRNLKIRNI